MARTTLAGVGSVLAVWRHHVDAGDAGVDGDPRERRPGVALVGAEAAGVAGELVDGGDAAGQRERPRLGRVLELVPGDLGAAAGLPAGVPERAVQRPDLGAALVDVGDAEAVAKIATTLKTDARRGITTGISARCRRRRLRRGDDE